MLPPSLCKCTSLHAEPDSAILNERRRLILMNLSSSAKGIGTKHFDGLQVNVRLKMSLKPNLNALSSSVNEGKEQQ